VKLEKQETSQNSDSSAQWICILYQTPEEEKKKKNNDKI